MSGDAPRGPGRLYPIAAANAPVVVVLRRAGRWWQVLRWDLETCRIEQGAWFRGNLYPYRCDVSRDGRLLCFYAMKTGKLFIGVSHIPWLRALALWRIDTTYHDGYYFASRREADKTAVGSPDEGSIARAHLLCVVWRRERYAQELRRGWVEHEACPSRGDDDPWDEKRAIVLARPQPSGKAQLILFDTGYRSGARGGRAPRFRLERGDEHIALDNVTWADWDARGRLLIATKDGSLQIRDVGRSELPVVARVDLGACAPKPEPAPDWAQRW